MNKKDLTLSLIRYRFTQSGVALGMDVGEAAMMAEARMKNEGLYGFLAGTKVMGTPEGGIVGIVEAFFSHWIPMLEQDLALKNQNKIDADEAGRRNKLSEKKAIDTVEAYRTRFYPGEGDHPHEIRPYVCYRMRVEMRHVHHLEPEQLGLDERTVIHMVDEAVQFFKGRVGKFRRS